MEDIEVLRSILKRQTSLVEENKKLKEENEEHLNASKVASQEVEEQNLILQEEISNLQADCESLKSQLEEKCKKLEDSRKVHGEHIEKIYDHLFERVKEMKILYRDFLILKKEHGENLEKLSKLNATLEDEKNAQAEAQKSLLQLEKEVTCLKESLEQKKEKLVEKDKIINEHYVNLQAAKEELNAKSITEDKTAQTDPCSKPRTTDVAMVTDPLPDPKNQLCQELPDLEWEPRDGVAKLSLTFKLGGALSVDQSSSNFLPAKNMKRKLPVNDEPSESSDVLKNKVLKNEFDSSATVGESTKVEEATSICESEMDAAAKGSEGDPKSATRKKFLQNLRKMRDFEMETFDDTKAKVQKNLLLKSMRELVANGEEEFLVDEIISHLLTRQADISLSREKQSVFAVSEQLIAACLVKFISKVESKMVNIFLNKALKVISSKVNQSTMGYASMCIVFSFICKRVAHVPNLRALCYEILMRRKEIAGFLIACIYCINVEAIEFSDSKVARVWLERVMWHILSRKPSGISEKLWKEVQAIHHDNAQFRDKSRECPERLLQEMMSAIKKHKRASLMDLVEDFGNALKLLASYQGKEWTDQVLKKHFATYKSSIRKLEQHTNILQLLEKLDNDIALFFGDDSNGCERDLDLTKC